MRLSKRLQAIADWIPTGDTVVDIGCDHAHLDIYLTLQGKNKCIATDLRESVLQIAQENIKNAHLEGQITLIQSDGMEKVTPPEKGGAVIAGMGCTTIVNILKNPKCMQFSYLIIQTNNAWDTLRRQLSIMGLQLTDEKVVLDQGKYYVLMKWEKGNVHYSKKQCFLGPLLVKQKDAKSYYQYLLQQYKTIQSALPFSYLTKRYHNYKKIKWLQKELKREL